ncbi:LON peptidase substrate-binding domain-containing protein [Herbaspirillum lusitanum]|jgi:Lon protease-like protein|uniref:LON peptidase substrate-binding domain-containing protein n=1 Tax=Herbaspirillum lusitanum TaxID=213312 RepID=A0ABW9A6X6_9BURK
MSTSLPLFPLSSTLFPDGRLPLQIFEVRYLDMINKCIADGSGFGVVALTSGSEVRKPGHSESFVPVGTLARINEWSSPTQGLLRISCVGTSRFRVLSSQLQKNGLWIAEIEPLEGDHAVPVPEELQDTVKTLTNLLDSLRHQSIAESDIPIAAPYRLNDCGWVANRWCELLPLNAEQKQALLALDNPLLRLELVQDALGERGWLK